MKTPEDFINRANELSEAAQTNLIDLAEDPSLYTREYILDRLGKTAHNVGVLANIAGHLLRMKGFVADRLQQAELALRIAERDVRDSEPWKRGKNASERDHIVTKASMLEQLEVERWQVARGTVANAINATSWVHNAVKMQDSDLRLHVRITEGPGEQTGGHGTGAIGALKFSHEPGEEPMEIT